MEKAMKGRAGITEQERAGDTARLELLYRRYVAEIYTICLRLLAAARAAEEATVAVFVRFSREAAARLEESQALARLRELSIDESLSRLNVRGRKAETPAPTMPLALVARDSRPASPLDRAALDRLVGSLPDHLRVAFVLRDREGLSEGAIAAHLRVDVTEVRRLVRSARLEVRRLWLGGPQA
jgi:DNA-directed RNA polymerase specialized sigma24 family protein